ncbi:MULTISPECIES: hypothetical protein [Paenibacillus]|uniref:hypothetical protein n=1 Tax=Paenibacillus TaxID=44249 RepID=UPI0022B8D5F5|nr:hypothetical protein [Paenibacillus caseinilyticus]MCZ8520493.1 hypothetical protein [Paenibacillus caseinilyticus]
MNDSKNQWIAGETFRMLKPNKVTVIFIVVAILAAAAIFTATTATPDHGVTAHREVEGNGLKEVKVDKEWGISFSGQSTSTHMFTINPDFGHVKLHVQNTGPTSFNINVSHRSSGTSYWATTVPGNSSATWFSWDKFPQGMMSGDYSVVFSGGNYDAIGTYWGKAANKPEVIINE